MLDRIRTVILDEIHAVVGNKRGTLLMSAVDRLVPLCGEFQRIALSATIHPEAAVAAFVAGFTMHDDPNDPRYAPRRIDRLRDRTRVRDIIRIRIPRAVTDADTTRDIWDDVAESLKTRIAAQRSTIVFTNSRRLCEKLTFLINADRSRPIAYAHHGSLSKALRLEVENRLKAGRLKAIVATASLELGIDIGQLDQVILVQSPSSISSAVQRIGRSGHGVGRSSRAEFVATHAVDVLTAAALREAVTEKKIEPVRPVSAPLDVLAQVVVSMTGVETWNADALYHTLRSSYPFHELTRIAFDLVVEMLAGRYADTRLAALRPKIAFDRLENALTARKGALLSLYGSGGVIPDRGYFTLRHQEGGARIGELDEEFVWEAKKGQVFTLGTQNWRIARITHNDVFVKPARPKAPVPPFWRSEDADQDFFLSDRIGRLLEHIHRRLDDPGLVDELVDRYGLDETAGRYLIDFLVRQQARTGCALPHRHHLVVEQMPAHSRGTGIGQIVIHTFWGGRVNRPFALALKTAWGRHYGHFPSIFPTNAAVYLMPAQTIVVDEILTLVSADTVESLLGDALEGSGIFGARFRECAARALLLPRRPFGQRMPLWLSRQQSQRLLDAVGRYADFPLVVEAWRSCLHDDFDLMALKRVLDELARGEIIWTVVKPPAASPMAVSGSWRLINQQMYADDRQPGRVKTHVSPDLLKTALSTRQWRPMVAAETVAEFEKKRQRLYPGYPPDSAVELLEWVKERLMIPWPEWQALLKRMHLREEKSVAAMLDAIGHKLLCLRPGGESSNGAANGYLVVAAETASAIVKGLYDEGAHVGWVTLAGGPVSTRIANRSGIAEPRLKATDILEQWLRFYGPLNVDCIANRLGLQTTHLNGLLALLIDEHRLVSGPLVDGQVDEQLCHADSYDTLLHMARHRRRAAIDPRDIDDLAPMLAHFQGLVTTGGKPPKLMDSLQSLMGVTLPAALWETEILPARIRSYDPRQLDYLMQVTPMMWIGSPGRQIAFCLEDDLDLFVGDEPQKDDQGKKNAPTGADINRLFNDPFGRYPLSALLGDPPRSVQVVLSMLWDAVWKGRVTNDTMIALRRETETPTRSRQAPRPLPAMGRGAVRRFRRDRSGLSTTLSAVTMGNWRLVNPPAPPDGLLEAEELVKDRIRLLLDRYGIVFRQLLDREAPPFRWSAIFRALRLMELSGEVTAGYFFKNIPGLQFVSPAMRERLRHDTPDDAVYWINALDPASLCGLKIDALKGTLPRRVAGTHLVYAGRRLAMVSRRSGKILCIHLPVDDPRLSDCLDLFDHLLGRIIQPMRSITIQSINGASPTRSPFLNLFRQRFDITIEPDTLTLYRRLAR